MITVTAAASCLRCDWTASGDWADVDRAADKHARSAGHPTMTAAGPAATIKTSATNPAAGTTEGAS